MPLSAAPEHAAGNDAGPDGRDHEQFEYSAAHIRPHPGGQQGVQRYSGAVGAEDPEPDN